MIPITSIISYHNILFYQLTVAEFFLLNVSFLCVCIALILLYWFLMQQKLNRSTLVNDFVYVALYLVGGRNDTHYFIITQSVYKLKRINCWYDEELLTYLSNMLGTIKNWTKTKQNWFKTESFRFDGSFT